MAYYPYATAVLTANATSTGTATVPDPTAFKVGALASLAGTGLPGLFCRIRDIVLSSGQVQLTVLDSTRIDDPSTAPPAASQDCSAYTVAAGATLTQEAQEVAAVEHATGTRLVGGIDRVGHPLALALGDRGGIARWKVDLSDANALKIATSTVDASVTLTPGWYRMVVSGVPAHVNVGAAATTSTTSIPVGAEDAPTWRDAQVFHALTDAGTGFVTFFPAIPI